MYAESKHRMREGIEREEKQKETKIQKRRPQLNKKGITTKSKK
jgi:hypothetical protein